MLQTIIITDDSTTARMITKRCLEIAGFQKSSFLEAKDGEEALQLAKDNPVDLMVIDLNMPKMDGSSLLKHIKSSPRLNHIPVLVISSLISQSKELELKEMGAFATLSKPISPAGLSKILNSLSNATEKLEQSTWD
jgi:two-component system chemotaxis response regulator CheY